MRDNGSRIVVRWGRGSFAARLKREPPLASESREAAFGYDLKQPLVPSFMPSVERNAIQSG